ncbi:hypothetical protein K9N68_23450 [Kovacikia minuta CCNUW1]|uniref:hypothetical protein n=1 Tax=Kovacikia minuta TaxID=2931930 RepID=UPI001CCE68D2|nr:hypothetical protein [Kovacikia minuta]UBF24611.1 hypothetical protein K9N68_23450 [Kovacikia minuta CCNUW1]
MVRFPFWLLRKTYPCMHILILSICLLSSRGAHQQQWQQLRLWFVICKIDFSALMMLAIDLTQPEFWV